MLELKDDLKFAEGGRRYCYVHPDDPLKCVKVLKPRGEPLHRRKKSPWYKKLRPLASFDDNLRELAAFKEMSRYDASIWEFFPKCYGMHPTNMGAGIVTDLVRDDTGSISLTIREYIKQHGKPPALLDALDRFFAKLIEERVVTRDLLDHNLVVRVHAGTATILLIDGFGSSDFISGKLAKLLPQQQKVRRKIKRFCQRYGI